MRRRAVMLGTAGLLGGCGFRPLYLPAGRTGSPADAELAAVFVPPIAERSGQLLRQALQQRLEGPGTGTAKRYELITAPAIAGDSLGILQTDSVVTRLRFNASADWTLRRLDPLHTVVTSGSSRIVDGLNIINSQYFAATLETETVYKRITESLADQIVTQLAVFLKRQATPPTS